jgi:hypothetical protein
MGMHFGVVASELTLAELLTAIGEKLPRMIDHGAIASLGDIEGATDEGFDLVVGDLEGRGYLLDSSYLLSGGEPDLIAAIASSSGKLIVGCGAETVSGTFYCVAARGDKLLRHYYQCNADLAVPFSSGTPFPSEPTSPLDDLYGGGFWTVLKDLGFDYERWEAESPKRRICWTADYLETRQPFPFAGPHSAAVDAHRNRHLLAKKDRPPIVLRMTHPTTGEVIDVPTRARIGDTEPATTKKPWWRFW